MKTFSALTKKLAFQASSGYCQCSPECNKTVTEFHHKFSNTKVNQQLYPLFLQSIFNCCPINSDCHMTKPLPRIQEYQVSVYEKWLMEFILENESF